MLPFFNDASEQPKVVYFPANQGPSAIEAVCQDDISIGSTQMGFNTFAFLSFVLTIFNAMR